MNEASARIKINKLLEEAGWRFSSEKGKPGNISLEHGATIKTSEIDAFGNDFDKTDKGFIDFLLLDESGSPLIVLEAKSEAKSPLDGKEQARKYARSQDCRFVILSNGNLHYFWDLERGNPHTLTSFPKPDSVENYKRVTPNPQRLIDERVGDDYIVLTQRPNYKSEAAWKNEAERPDFIKANKLRFLRPYQLQAVHALKGAVKEGNDRFLFEMATGTGKTLTAAAIIKLFLRSGNAHRVLFLVDRLELEKQAEKVFSEILSADFDTAVYKENRDDWRRAEIVVSTVQSFLFNNKYQKLFSATDFDLVISDEAHRSISGNARAVFEHFVGYKLGLTATPYDYLQGVTTSDSSLRDRDPRETERRQWKDTYRTFGCESGQPTFRYSLIDGAKDEMLINPTVVGAMTVVTTQLLSEQGFIVSFTDAEGEDQEETYKRGQFERSFFSKATNEIFCKTFLENALRDPVSHEIGKSIVFAVSQKHAARLTNILNQMAHRMFPGKYQSDFAVQVTSSIAEDAQQYTINFANNNLLGKSNFLPQYRTSKARVCVTVGMMTTGYDCPDILNLALFRPIFSPTDFIQIKGRGTRRHNFLDSLSDDSLKENIQNPEKTTFKLFDFFRNCEYFESGFNYDEVLKLPERRHGKEGEVYPEPNVSLDVHEYLGEDVLSEITEERIGYEGMRVDRMYFDKFADTVRGDETIVKAVEAGRWEYVTDYVNREVFDKPEEYYTLKKLRQAVNADRRLSLREILEKIFDFIQRFKSWKELLEEEYNKFVADHKPEDPRSIPAIKAFFEAFITSDRTRQIIEQGDYGLLDTNPAFPLSDFRAVPEEYQKLIPEYIRDYVPLNQFVV